MTMPVDAALEAVVRRDRVPVVTALAAVFALSGAYLLAEPEFKPTARSGRTAGGPKPAVRWWAEPRCKQGSSSPSATPQFVPSRCMAHRLAGARSTRLRARSARLGA
jgi:hypothetical protein